MFLFKKMIQKIKPLLPLSFFFFTFLILPQCLFAGKTIQIQMDQFKGGTAYDPSLGWVYEPRNPISHKGKILRTQRNGASVTSSLNLPKGKWRVRIRLADQASNGVLIIDHKIFRYGFPQGKGTHWETQDLGFFSLNEAKHIFIELIHLSPSQGGSRIDQITLTPFSDGDISKRVKENPVNFGSIFQRETPWFHSFYWTPGKKGEKLKQVEVTKGDFFLWCSSCPKGQEKTISFESPAESPQNIWIIANLNTHSQNAAKNPGELRISTSNRSFTIPIQKTIISPPPPPSFEQKVSKDVQVKQIVRVKIKTVWPWSKTGVYVRSKDWIRISAKGKTRNGDRSVEPDGFYKGGENNIAGYSGYLRARVDSGRKRNIIYVGKSRTWQSPVSGLLYLGIQDDVLMDNGGAWNVSIDLLR